MKAILKTKCGCTREISISSDFPIIRIPLQPPTGYFVVLSKGEDVPVDETKYREFKIASRSRLFSEDVLCYEEV